MKQKLICIGGGLGPMAGVEFHKLIIEHTPINGIEQNHIEVHHYSRPHDITERMQFILKGKGENPAEGMLRTVLAGYASANSVNRKIVLGIPCITFHAPVIFDEFLNLVKRHELDVQVLSIVEETINHIKILFPKVKNIGLMSTTGARSARVFRDELGALNNNLIEVPPEMQEELQQSIENPDWGIKAAYPVHEKSNSNFKKYAKYLIGQGADIIILACTDIPLALSFKEMNGIQLINPSEILAKALIREVVDSN